MVFRINRNLINYKTLNYYNGIHVFSIRCVQIFNGRRTQGQIGDIYRPGKYESNRPTNTQIIRTAGIEFSGR